MKRKEKESYPLYENSGEYKPPLMPRIRTQVSTNCTAII